jgi:hypothetical protein
MTSRMNKTKIIPIEVKGLIIGTTGSMHTDMEAPLSGPFGQLYSVYYVSETRPTVYLPNSIKNYHNIHSYGDKLPIFMDR